MTKNNEVNMVPGEHRCEWKGCAHVTKWQYCEPHAQRRIDDLEAALSLKAIPLRIVKAAGPSATPAWAAVRDGLRRVAQESGAVQ